MPDNQSDMNASPGMLCPGCKLALVMTERQNIEIDYCPDCRGVWLDRGELDKIIERSLSPKDETPLNDGRENRGGGGHGGSRHGGGGHGSGSHGGGGHSGRGYQQRSWLQDLFH